MTRRSSRYAGVLAISDDRVLLVRERYDDGALHWGIPSGRVEPGETFAEGAARELTEETGLTVTPSGLREFARVTVRRSDGRADHSVDFVAHVDPHDPVVADPDGHVSEAAWVPMSRALLQLREVAYLPLVEPIVHFLTVPSVSDWSYTDAALPGERTASVLFDSQ